LEPPDLTEKTLRFGCGFIFGLLVTGLSGFLWSVASGHYVVAVSVLAALICGVLALRYGDRFWHWLSRFSWWWPWWY